MSGVILIFIPVLGRSNGISSFLQRGAQAGIGVGQQASLKKG
jgi:hypothetical protein